MEEKDYLLPSCRSCHYYMKRGRRKCKKCEHYWNSNFKEKRELSRSYQVRKQKQESPELLVKVYEELRQNVFPEGYLRPSSNVIFKWKRGTGGASYCRYSRPPRIEIGGGFRTISSTEKFQNWKNLYEIMLHEALHIRIHNHRKNFKLVEKTLGEKLSQYLTSKGGE